MTDETLPSYDELLKAQGVPPGSSWGVWGADDQRGCLNLLTEERTLAAMALVRDGRAISLNAPVELFEKPLFGRPGMEHRIQEVNYGRSRDDLLFSYNTQSSSQWDGLGHVKHEEHGFYNGLPPERLSISGWAESGIAGRGVLLDVEGFRAEDGRPIRHEDSDPITVDDLEATAHAQGIDIATGDILIVHTGWLDWARSTVPEGFEVKFRTPGLRPGRDMLRYLWDLHIAAIASDTPSVEAWPPGAFSTKEHRQASKEDSSLIVDTFMHGEILALLGLPLGELWATGELARHCRQTGRWAFLLTAAPMNLPGGAASPANALAIV